MVVAVLACVSTIVDVTLIGVEILGVKGGGVDVPTPTSIPVEILGVKGGGVEVPTPTSTPVEILACIDTTGGGIEPDVTVEISATGNGVESDVVVEILCIGAAGGGVDVMVMSTGSSTGALFRSSSALTATAMWSLSGSSSVRTPAVLGCDIPVGKEVIA